MRPRHASGPDARPWSVRPAWYALHTHARSERKVVEALELGGIRCLFPAIPRRRRWYDRRAISHRPLFPGYVFARVEPQAVPFLARITGISDVVRSGYRPAAIPDDEIANIERLARTLSEQHADAPPVPYTDGERVRIMDGPFEGIVGVILEKEPPCVVVGIRAIGMGVELSVARNSLSVVH